MKYARTDNLGRYHSWLKQQFEQRQAAVIRAQSYGTAQHGQYCLACSSVAEASGQAITSLIQDVQQSTDSSTLPGETLLCLFHWQQAHELCARKPETLALQERLLHRQQQQFPQLDSALEAYLARFNAAKRGRRRGTRHPRCNMGLGAPTGLLRWGTHPGIYAGWLTVGLSTMCERNRPEGWPGTTASAGGCQVLPLIIQVLKGRP